MSTLYDHAGFGTTKPRGPIAAMYCSPGPAYGLPSLVGQNTHDPRSVHRKGPAYPFGVRHGKFKDDCSPGPCYLPQSKYYRDGMDGTPHYSLYSRNADLTAFKTPGPGSYNNEVNGGQTCYSAPRFSFGGRQRSRRTDNVPAPNVYSLPTVLGKTTESGKKQAPNYSLVGRSLVGHFAEDLAKTPGPGAYSVPGSDKFKNAAPQYSMTGRNALPGDNTRKPGPGAHSPEDAAAVKRKAPKFSFGIRHSQYTAPLIVTADE